MFPAQRKRYAEGRPHAKFTRNGDGATVERGDLFDPSQTQPGPHLAWRGGGRLIEAVENIRQMFPEDALPGVGDLETEDISVSLGREFDEPLPGELERIREK